MLTFFIMLNKNKNNTNNNQQILINQPYNIISIKNFGSISSQN